jgi:SCY1-like protein 1
MLDNFPRHVCTRKILPELIKAFEFGNAGAAILNPVFKLGRDLSSAEYVRRIVPCVVKLFASNDRNARFKVRLERTFREFCKKGCQVNLTVRHVPS